MAGSARFGHAAPGWRTSKNYCTMERETSGCSGGGRGLAGVALERERATAHQLANRPISGDALQFQELTCRGQRNGWAPYVSVAGGTMDGRFIAGSLSVGS